ncbi:hypothetical protein CCYA_CCYA08G2257 [Cyanidiococcus yangmingshanensis]|nr:hypothetical protein CCYA_CCYA08G2257 [Cyanidiococcus yangmingshanensis]
MNNVRDEVTAVQTEENAGEGYSTEVAAPVRDVPPSSPSLETRLASEALSRVGTEAEERRLPSMPLEERFFGFHPGVLVQEIEQSVRDLLEDALDGLEISLYRDCFLDPEFCKENANGGEQEEARRMLLQRGLMRLREALFAAFYGQMDRLEVYLLRNVFHIPFGLRIPGVNASENLDGDWEQELGVDASVLSLDATSDDEDAVDRELVELRRSLRATRQMQQRLQKERSALATCFRRLECDAHSRVAAVLAPEGPESARSGALAEQVAAVAGAVQQLEQIVNSCRDQLSQASSTGDKVRVPGVGKTDFTELARRGPEEQRIRRPLELERIFESHVKDAQVESLDAIDALRRALHHSY